MEKIKKDVFLTLMLHVFRNDLPFEPESIQIEKFKKLVTNLLDKTEYIIHIINLKQALNHRLVI